MSILRYAEGACISICLSMSYIKNQFQQLAISDLLPTFCLSINWMNMTLMSFNYATYINLCRNLSIIYIWIFLVFSFMESSVLTIMDLFSFYSGLWNFVLQINRLILDRFRFLARVNIEIYLVVSFFERWMLALNDFADAFYCYVYWNIRVFIS